MYVQLRHQTKNQRSMMKITVTMRTMSHINIIKELLEERSFGSIHRSAANVATNIGKSFLKG